VTPGLDGGWMQGGTRKPDAGPGGVLAQGHSPATKEDVVATRKKRTTRPKSRRSGPEGELDFSIEDELSDEQLTAQLMSSGRAMDINMKMLIAQEGMQLRRMSHHYDTLVTRQQEAHDRHVKELEKHFSNATTQANVANNGTLVQWLLNSINAAGGSGRSLDDLLQGATTAQGGVDVATLRSIIGPQVPTDAVASGVAANVLETVAKPLAEAIAELKAVVATLNTKT
jgi:hypothetical protein